MTRRRSPISLFAPVLAAALLALLILAAMQYYWVGQVSAGELERRQASLELSAQRMSEDFNRELARAYLSLQMDAATLRDQDWARYATRYDSWRATAPYAGMVKDIYLVEVNQIGRVSLSHYSAERRSFESLAWPYEMLPLRRGFERTYRQIFEHGDTLRVAVDPVDARFPSLLVPVSRPWLLSNQQDLGIDADLLFSDLIFPGTYVRCARCPPEMFDTPLLAHTIVALDEGYISSTMFPALVGRYFPGDSGADYHVAVLDRADPERAIYRSDLRLAPSAFSASDVSVGLFDLSYADLNALLLANDLAAGPDATGAQPDRIVIGVLGRPGDELSDTDLAARGHWRLLLKHREGSLDAAVANLRTRNLLLSFGILLLLAVSTAMLLISTRRAQLLARQQIEFASAVSHELRTPLAVICSAGENLADGLIHDPQKARQYGAVIYGEGRRLTDMVEQVLTFAGAQSGRERYVFQRLDVLPVVESAIQAMQHQLREGGHTLDLTAAPGLPPADVDSIALRRSLQNLIGNAIKYGGEARWIGVDVAPSVSGHRAELLIRVSDRGPGIDPGDLPHLFEPFYRGRSAVATQAHGSGLGLSLVRNAVEAHGGRVAISSPPGQGTCFTLHLPAAAVGAAAVHQPVIRGTGDRGQGTGRA
ncbi:HAMP domain-containing histidine kinase [Oscillochloris sp. ZM17-4]|uniref:sensor histidine kinase n=1 Tax=Oscillochloris sp. ZM17-4 TaxID=2866714 RepID=UPI001C72E577|nr:HAMP domain-containing sensor histidine kinase [Oscillochloris sp. ZM17-4]MBX0329956.1 HAMP domain-containing histidine kinase [Oscillochloris sp. ZM17-4]